jgi:hypothetical protein
LTIWPNIEKRTFDVASLWAGVNFFSVKMFIAFLYSYRWSIRGTSPSLSSVPRRKGLWARRPVRPMSPDGCK